VPNKHTKQLHSKKSAQFYVVRPVHAAPAVLPYLRAIKGHLRTWPPNGQTAENRAKRQTESPIAFPIQGFKSRQAVPCSHDPTDFLRATRCTCAPASAPAPATRSCLIAKLASACSKGGAELPLPALRRQAPRWPRGWVGGPRARSRTPPTSAPFAKKVGS
jgi:hypothetical protein